MTESQIKHSEKRLSARAKFSKMLRVRPSEPKETHFEDLPISVNVSKHGIYFHTNRPGYHHGMRLFVTFPFTFVDDPMSREYLAEVVRVESLTNGRFGVGIRLLTTV